ncbi:MAG: nucleotidyltransferase family protein [Paludibacteraceae bacterium]|nr:nucleotidyltransferase family protein [Paludibacteraceae bacterium]
MDATEAYFSLIRRTLFGSDEPLSEVVPKQVMTIAVRQSTVALHAQALLALPSDVTAGMTGQLKQWLQAQVVHNIQAQQTRGNWMAEIIALLRENDIPVVLMKGYGLACLYGNPDLREQGDVDLYIGKEHYHEGCELLRRQWPDCYWQSDEEGGKHFIFIPKEDMSRIVELHHQTAEFSNRSDLRYWSELEREGMTNGLGSVQWKDCHISTPEAAFNALYVFVHLWHHFLHGGCSWRQLTDWALSLRTAGDAIDEQLLEQHLVSLHLKAPWQALGLLVCRRLHLPADMMPLYTERYTRLADRLDQLILRDGHGGRKPHYFQRMPRPHNRPMQVIRVIGRLTEDCCFLLPLFPSIALRELNGKLFG